MREQCFDRRHIEFAKYLNIPAEFVEEIYLRVGVDQTPDREERHELADAITKFTQAIGHLRKAEQAIDSLPESEKIVLTMTNSDCLNDIAVIADRLSSIKGSREKLASNAAGRGPRNSKADRFADFVAILFEEIGRDIRIGTNPYSSDPNTEFGRAVQTGLELYEHRHPPETKEEHFSRADGLVKTDKTVFNGEVINWRRPAERAAKKHNK